MHANTPPILIATTNHGKLREARAILEQSLPGPIRGLDDLDAPIAEPVEDGDTFEANARLKAEWYAERTGMICLADDSGLVVDALDGAPGVLSARFGSDRFPAGADRGTRDRINRELLMERMDGVATSERTARFVCSIVLAAPDRGAILHAQGTFEGCIGEAPRVPAGANGFGYDPIFLVAPAFDVTCAEMTPADKNAISHRGHALRELAKRLNAVSLRG